MGTTRSTTTGTYSSPLSLGDGSGTVSGTMGYYSGQGVSYQFSTREGQDASGVVTQSGTWGDGDGGYSGDWYSGSGSYAAASASGGGASASPGISSAPDATAVPGASGGPARAVRR